MVGRANCNVFTTLCYTARLLSAVVVDRDFHVTVVPSKGLVSDAVHTEVVYRLVDCVYKCTVFLGCTSLTLNKNTSLCKFYSSVHDVVRQEESNIFYATLIKAHEHYITKTAYTTKAGTPATEQCSLSGKLILISEKMVWREARQRCIDYNSTLIIIKNEEKQKEAVKCAMKSGLEDLAIGVYIYLGIWQTVDGKRIVYNAWGNGQPFYLGMFGMMSRTLDYKWASTSNPVCGAICEVNE